MSTHYEVHSEGLAAIVELATVTEGTNLSKRCLTWNLKNLDKYVEAVLTTGSWYIESPQKTSTDVDYFAYVKSHNLLFVVAALQDLGFEPCGDYKTVNQGRGFISYRQGAVNFTVLLCPKQYEAAAQATELAKKWNLREKEIRVALFEQLRALALLVNIELPVVPTSNIVVPNLPEEEE